MAVSMNKVWDESVAFIRRESALLVPLVLATVALGAAAFNIIKPIAAHSGSSPLWSLLLGFSLGLIVIGQQAIFALALQPGRSVAEAIAVGVRSLPKFAGLVALLVAFVLIAMLPLTLALGAAGVDLAARQPELPPLAIFYVALLLVSMAWLNLRLITLLPLIIDRNPPLFAAIRESFAATRGQAARLLGVTLLYSIVAGVVVAATGAVAGLIFRLIGEAAGAPFAGHVLLALVLAGVNAGFVLIATTFVARYYRALTS